METLNAAMSGSLLAAVYLVYQLPAVWTAVLLARRFAPRRWCEFLTVAGFLYELLMIALPGVLGLCGLLDHLFVASMALAAGVTVITWKKPWKPLRPEQFTAPELLMIALAAGFLFYQWRMFAYLPVIGTDAQTYHIYYPAVWLAEGRLERIVQPGLMTATYPCYGELIYCWHMAPVRLDFFARNIQFFHLLLAGIAVVAAGQAAGFRRAAAIAAASFVIFSGVVFRNASVANTDLMVGANLVIGTALLIPAMRRNSAAWFGLAGAAFGVAAATKYLGFLLAPPMLLALGGGILFFRRSCRNGVLCSFLVAAVTAAPCFVANWITYGNPVFPVRLGIGSFSLFSSFMTEPSPTLGWSLRAWHYFVDGAKNSLSFWNALLLGAGCLALFLYVFTAGRRRRGGRMLLFFAVLLLVLLLLQLKLYPSITQPRQIVPLVMLAAAAGIGILALGPALLECVLHSRVGEDIQDSNSDRLQFLARAADDFLRHPVFGIGLCSTRNADVFTGVEGSMVFYHNSLAQVMGSMGLVGIVAYGRLLHDRIALLRQGSRDPFVRILTLSYLGMFLISLCNPGEFCPFPNAALMVMVFAQAEEAVGDVAVPVRQLLARHLGAPAGFLQF